MRRAASGEAERQVGGRGLITAQSCIYLQLRLGLIRSCTGSGYAYPLM
jgi:hypothetical protein